MGLTVDEARKWLSLSIAVSACLGFSLLIFLLWKNRFDPELTNLAWK